MIKKIKIIVLIILGAVLFLSLCYLIVFGRALGQEENHLGIALALPRVVLSSGIVQIDNKTYLAKNNTSFIEEMERQGFYYKEQFGAGYLFEKGIDAFISTSRMYSSHFMVFTHPIKMENKSSDS